MKLRKMANEQKPSESMLNYQQLPLYCAIKLKEETDRLYPTYIGTSEVGKSALMNSMRQTFSALAAETAPASLQVYLNQANFLIGRLQEVGELNMQDERGQTILMQAVRNGSLEMVRRLLTLGANMNVHDYYGNTALHYAVLTGFEALLVELLVGNVRGKDADAVLLEQLAAARRVPESAEEACNRQEVNLNAKNCDGKTALYLATELQEASLVRILVKFGALDTAEHSAGKSPLHKAVELQDKELLTALLNENGLINVNAKTYAGETALSRAQQLGNDAIVEFLKNCGASEGLDDSDYDE